MRVLFVRTTERSSLVKKGLRNRASSLSVCEDGDEGYAWPSDRPMTHPAGHLAPGREGMTILGNWGNE
jgi:hypothetical protein